MANSPQAGWDYVPLRALVSRCDYGLSCALDTNSNGIPVLRMGNLVNGRVCAEDLKFIPPWKLPSEDDLLAPGDLLLNRTNSFDRVGKVGLFIRTEKMTFASYLFRLRIMPEKTMSEWLVQVLGSDSYQGRLRNLATPGVSQANINRSALLDLEVAVPPLPEQRKMAAILSSVDDTIEKTEAVIDQLEVVKKGLLGELLTRGMPGRHRDFRETEVGFIPRGWSIRRLGEVARIERGRFSHRPRNEPRLYGGRYPFVQTGDVAPCRGRLKGFSQTLNEEGLAVSKLFPAGTIVMTIAANIGDTGIAAMDVAFPDSLVGIRPGPDAEVRFLEYVLRTRKQQLEDAAPQNA